MSKNDLRLFIEHWDKVLKQRETIQSKPKPSPTSFFTDTKNQKGGPSAELVEGWHRIMSGAEELEDDYRTSIRSDELAADEGEGWLSKGLEDYGPPPSGRAGDQPDMVLQESKSNEIHDQDHWRRLAQKLKIKEARSVKGSGYVNTADAAAMLEMSMEHFLRCVWNVPGFAAPEKFREGMAYRVDKIQEIAKVIKEAAEHMGRSKKAPKEGFGTLVRGDKQVTKGDITYENEPTTWWSVGPDVADYGDTSDNQPVRVSKFSTSPEINDVAEMRRSLEILERRIHKADVEGDKSKRDKLVGELKTLRKKINKTSDDMQSKADTDVT